MLEMCNDKVSLKHDLQKIVLSSLFCLLPLGRITEVKKLEASSKTLPHRSISKPHLIHSLYRPKCSHGTGKGARDAIGELLVLEEINLQHGQGIYICFVDSEKVFRWSRLMNALRKYM